MQIGDLIGLLIVSSTIDPPHKESRWRLRPKKVCCATFGSVSVKSNRQGFLRAWGDRTRWPNAEMNGSGQWKFSKRNNAWGEIAQEVPFAALRVISYAQLCDLVEENSQMMVMHCDLKWFIDRWIMDSSWLNGIAMMKAEDRIIFNRRISLLLLFI